MHPNLKLIPSNQDGFQCLMEIEGARELVKASVQNSQLVCDRSQVSDGGFFFFNLPFRTYIDELNLDGEGVV